MARPFKLEAVLSHRRHREETARKVFADAVRELRRMESILGELEGERRRYRQTLRSKQKSGGAAMEILLYTRYLMRLDGEIAAQRKQVQAQRQEKEHKRLALMATLKDRKVIEKLKEHHLTQLGQEERQLEQKLLNDVAISRYQRADNNA